MVPLKCIICADKSAWISVLETLRDEMALDEVVVFFMQFGDANRNTKDTIYEGTGAERVQSELIKLKLLTGLKLR